MKKIFILFWLLGSILSNAATIETFSPQSRASGFRTIRVKFSDPMIPFGDTRAAVIPFEIQCKIPPNKDILAPWEKSRLKKRGEKTLSEPVARWVDPQNWIYEFSSDVPAGATCKAILTKSLKTLKGEIVQGQGTYEISTGGPMISDKNRYDKSEIGPQDALLFEFKTAPKLEQLKQKAYFIVEGLPGLVGVNLIEGKMREEILKSTQNRYSEGENALSNYQRHAHRVVILQPARALPMGKSVTFMIDRGLEGETGVATDELQKVEYRVRHQFEVGFSCERESADAACLPFSDFRLQFSDPVEKKWIQGIRLIDSHGKEFKVKFSENDENSELSFQNARFSGPFHEKSKFTIKLPKGFVSENGDRPTNFSKFPLKVETDVMPPLLKFPTTFGIYESEPGATIPVTVRRVESEILGTLSTYRLEKADLNKIDHWIQTTSTQSYDWKERESTALKGSVAVDEFETKEIRIPKPGAQDAFEVMGVPIQKPGLYLLEMKSRALGTALIGQNRDFFVSTLALVTKMGVHLKLGNARSLVWVTELNTGKPLANAQVQVKCFSGQVLDSGKTDADGIFYFENGPGQHRRKGKDRKSEECSGEMMAEARLGEDWSFVRSSWDKGIESWRYGSNHLQEYDRAEPEMIATVFDRQLLKNGETIHMKHFLRKTTEKGWELLNPDFNTKKLTVKHWGSDDTFDLPIQWQAKDSTGVTEWKVPTSAKKGTYAVYFGDKMSGSFRVDDFRIPLMKGAVVLPRDKQVDVIKIPVDLSLKYFAGAAASHQKVVLRSSVVEQASAFFSEKSDFSFSNGSGLEDASKKKRHQESESEEGDEEVKGVHRKEMVLDKNGSLHTEVQAGEVSPKIKNVMIEMEYRDPNGEIKTSAQGLTLYPTSRLVGVRPLSWSNTEKSMPVQAAVVGLKGEPVQNAKVDIELYQRVTLTHRRKLMGGFYAYENKTDTKKLDATCSGSTNSDGLFDCDLATKKAGSFIVVAKVRDDKNRVNVSHDTAYAYSSERVWWEQDKDDRIDLIPSKKEYQPGDTAEFQVRSPFEKATVLVTKEREGVLNAKVIEISGAKPTLNVLIEDTDTPNIVVSALLVRGRVGEVQPTALLDLGKPAFKMGLAEIRVGFEKHRLKVDVRPQKDVVKTRETVKVKFHITDFKGAPLGVNSEILVAVVDEGLLSLKANTSTQLLEKMMQLRRHQVETSTAQTQIVGKRHFGLKALPTGGGGGRSMTRELFDPVVYWNPRVVVSKDGDAEIELKMNDSLSSFEILAVAHSGVDRFGTGKSSIKATQDLLVFPAVVPLARNGDELPIGITYQNTTEQPIELEASVAVKGLKQTFEKKSITVGARDSAKVSWRVQIPSEETELEYLFLTHSKSNAVLNDEVKLKQKLVQPTDVSTYQALLKQLVPSQAEKFDVKRPLDAIKGRGELKLILDRSVAGSLKSVEDEMRLYPYSCLEQKLSKAIVANDQKRFEEILGELPSYFDSRGLLKYFPLSEFGDEVLTSYFLSVVHENGWKIPEAYVTRMISGLKNYLSGHYLDSLHGGFYFADTSLRKLTILSAISQYSEVSQDDLAGVNFTAEVWPTSTLIDAYFLYKKFPAFEARFKKISEILNSRITYNGTRMGFSTESSDGMPWLMVSSDVNSAKMILLAMKDGVNRNDTGKLVVGFVSRQHKGKWYSTLANAWGSIAIREFVKKFEADPVTGTTVAELQGVLKKLEWNASQLTQSFEWPEKEAALEITHQGAGSPWLTLQSRAALQLKKPIFNGYRIERTIKAAEKKAEKKDSKVPTAGDVCEVTLKVEALSDQTWVVLREDIPAGATVLGNMHSDGNIAFEENSFTEVKAYMPYLYKGAHKFSYRYRLNQGGKVQVPGTRIEAMYSPDVFGELPATVLDVKGD